MRVWVESDVPGATVHVSGELDMATANDLIEGVRRSLLRGPGDLTLDLSGLSFMDSTGLLALLDLSKQLEGRGRLIVLSSPRPVARLLQLARADTIPNLVIGPDHSTAA
jgi:anti-sigma B factor antagonist